MKITLQPDPEINPKPLRFPHPADGLRLLFWIYFQPSLLRSYLEQATGRNLTTGGIVRLWECFRNPAIKPLLPHGIVAALLLGVLTYTLTGIAAGTPLGWTDVRVIALGIALGVVCGVMFGELAGGVEYSVLLGVAGGMVGGVAGGVTATRLTMGLTRFRLSEVGELADSVKTVTVGGVEGVVSGVAIGIVWGMAAVAMSGIAEGVAFGVAFGVVLGVAMIVAGAFILIFPILDLALFLIGVGFGWILGILRVPIPAIFEWPISIWRFQRSRIGKDLPHQSLLRSPAGFDELQIIRQPFLQEFLYLACRDDLANGLWAVPQVVSNPFQRWAAQHAVKRLLTDTPNLIFPILQTVLMEPAFLRPIAPPWGRFRFAEVRTVLIAELAGRRALDLPFFEGLVTRLTASLRDRTPSPADPVADFYFQLLTLEEPGLSPLLPLLESARTLPHGEGVYGYFQHLAACEACTSLDDVAGLPSALPASLPDFVPDSMYRNLDLLDEVVRECRHRVTASSPVNRSQTLNRASAALERWREHVETLTDPEARALRGIVKHWASLLADVGEREGVRPRAPVRNPYIAGNPVPDSLLVGRDDVFRRIEHLWHGRDDPPSILLYGHRRMGKSSILRNLGGHLDDATHLVYLDMQRLQARTTEGLLAGIAREIHRSLPAEMAPPRPRIEEFDHEPYLRFDGFLTDVEPLLDGKRLLLAIDEYELLAQKIESGQWDRDLLPYLRGLLQSQLRVTLIFAGLHTQEQMTHDYSHGFWSSVTLVQVSYLKRDDAARLITSPSEDFPVDYDTDAVERILDATHGQPYLIQQICEELVIRLNDRLSRSEAEIELRICLEDVEEVMGRLISAGGYYEGLWKQVESETGRRVLRALAAEEPLGAESLSQRLDVSEADVHRSLELLEKLDIVVPQATDDGFGWKFQVELLRRWLQGHPERGA